MKAAELKTFLATAVSYRKHSCEDGGHGRGRPPNWIKYQDATDMAALVEHAKAAHGYVIGETRPWGRLNVRSQAHILPICPCFCIGKSEEEDKRMHSELYQLPTASSRSCSGAPLAARGGARRCTSSPQLPAAHACIAVHGTAGWQLYKPLYAFMFVPALTLRRGQGGQEGRGGGQAHAQ